ncbi:hypothetical protein ACTA71_006719 [Dictyostelium dimigraforme]
MSTNNSTECFNFPPPPENLINYSNNDTILNKQNTSTTTTTTTTSENNNNNNMRPAPPTPNQSNYNYNDNTNNFSGNNPTYAQIPQQPISMQQSSYYEQPPPGYHGENPPISTMDSFLSKGKVYTDQTKNKIIELNEQYKVTETVKKTAHDAKPKIISGFNFMKSKINDLIEGKGTRSSGGPEINPAMITTNKNQQYYQSQNYQQPQNYQQQYYQQQPNNQQYTQQFNQNYQQTPVLEKQNQFPISEPRKSESYSVEQQK